MSTLLQNRVQSAYSRSSLRAGKDGQHAHLRPRPTSSVSTHQRSSNVFDQAPLDALESPSFSPPAPPPSGRRRRPKTASTNTSASARPASRKLRSDEIDSLVRSLERNDAFIVEIDCLAEYRTLVQTIDLRRTPIDCQILCALQQRENLIVQHNACRDVRFLSLIETLGPKDLSGKDEQNDSDEMNGPNYPPGDLPYGYMP